jgi:hypothetical protein
MSTSNGTSSQTQMAPNNGPDLAAGLPPRAEAPFEAIVEANVGRLAELEA